MTTVNSSVALSQDYPEQSEFSYLPSVHQLFDVLNKQGISYCHWKSNYHLHYALSAREDIDILIASDDFAAFLSIVFDSGFKEISDTVGQRQAGVFHFIGVDRESNELIHLHAYKRILTGDHVLKSWSLAFENLLLEDTRQLHGVHVPAKEAEIIIFVFRNMIKYTTLIDFLMMRRSRQVIQEEYQWLTRDLDMQRVNEKLARHFPELSHTDFTRALALLENPQQAGEKIRLGFRFTRALRRYQRFSLPQRLLFTLAAVPPMLFRRYIVREKHMKLRGSGAIIAFVGPQATGKSTLTNNAKQWLEKEISVCCIHVGKPPSAWLTWPFNKSIPLARVFFPHQATTEIDKQAEQVPTDHFSMIYLLRKVILAYDRRKLLRKAYQRSRTGQIVLCDRYPSETVGAIDGATFSDEMLAKQTSQIKRWLMKIEQYIYQGIARPDLVFQLSIPIEKAVHRDQVRDKPGLKDPEYVRFRHTMRCKPEFPLSPVIGISTEQDLEVTLRQLKQEIWRIL